MTQTRGGQWERGPRGLNRNTREWCGNPAPEPRGDAHMDRACCNNSSARWAATCEVAVAMSVARFVPGRTEKGPATGADEQGGGAWLILEPREVAGNVPTTRLPRRLCCEFRKCATKIQQRVSFRDFQRCRTFPHLPAMLRRVAPIARPRIPQRAMNTHKPHHTPVPRTTQLRQMIAKGQMSFIMEAHRCVTTLLLTCD